MRRTLVGYCRRAFERFIYNKIEVAFFQCYGTSFSLPEGWTLVQPNCDQLLSLQNDYTVPRESIIYKRYRRGDTCHLLCYRGEVAHIAWSGRCKELKATYELGEKQSVVLDDEVIFFFDCWTPETMRGKGAYRKTLQQLMIDPQQAYWVACLVSNYPSFRALMKMGFVPKRLITRCHILGLDLYQSSDAQPNDFARFLD